MHFKSSVFSTFSHWHCWGNKNYLFSLSRDGSNGTDTEKMNPLTACFYNVNSNCVATSFLDMCCNSGKDCGTASTILNKIDSKITEFEVPWNNHTGFSVYNTSVNLGAHNVILSWVLVKNKSCYFMCYPCHLIHNTANKWAFMLFTLPLELPDKTKLHL